MHNNIESSTSSSKSPLETHLATIYPVLTQEERDSFISCHGWLENEPDPSIIDNYLTEHFKAIGARYEAILKSLLSENPSENGPISVQPEPSQELNEFLLEDESKIVERAQKSLEDKIEIEPEPDPFDKFVNKLEVMYQDIYEMRRQQTRYARLMTLLETIISGLLDHPNDPMKRQVQITDSQLREERLVDVLTNELGFEIAIDEPEELLLMMVEEPSHEFLTVAGEVVRALISTKTGKVSENKGSDRRSEDTRAGFLASRHEERLSKVVTEGSEGNGAGISGMERGSEDNMPGMRDQINEYRNRMRGRFMDSRKFSGGSNFMTIGDMEKRERQADMAPRQANQPFGSKVVTMKDIEGRREAEDKVNFGLRALELTNKFRAENGLPKLVWSQELCDVGMVHSKDMAEGKVPFGHQGFDKRCRAVKFPKRSMAENVALNYGLSDPAKVAVDGWIKSPGHRKNLLSNSNCCGIAVYKAENGTWYFTQLLAYRT